MRVFDYSENIKYPQYIMDAIKSIDFNHQYGFINYAKRGTKNSAPVWHCMNFVKRGKTECPKCKAIKETIIENCFVEAYKVLCSDKGDIVENFINRMNSIITENSSDKLIEKIELEKQKLNSKMNKLIDLSLDNAIDRYTFLERKEKLQNQIEQLNMKQDKLMLDERFNAIVDYVIVGGFDENGKLNKVLRNGLKIRVECDIT